MKVAQKHVNNNINRSATEASQSSGQNQLAQVTDNRKETVSQRALIDGINDSPRMLAQCRKIEDYIGSGQQPATLKAYSNRPVPSIQAKLTIGQPADKYEQEADRIAAQVVKQINIPASAKSPQKQSVLREAMPEETLQTKPILQHRESIGGREAPADLESAINSSKGGGQALDAGLQQSMGQAMGADFSGVRVHTDAQADQLNQSILARAFTTGQDVFFRQGAYQHGSHGGQELIAHELTHVVQQTGAGMGLKRVQRIVNRDVLKIVGENHRDYLHKPEEGMERLRSQEQQTEGYGKEETFCKEGEVRTKAGAHTSFTSSEQSTQTIIQPKLVMLPVNDRNKQPVNQTAQPLINQVHVFERTSSTQGDLGQRQEDPEQTEFKSNGMDRLHLKEFSSPNTRIVQPQCADCALAEKKDKEKWVLQPKLAIAQPVDRYEDEANHVASEVVKRIHAPELQLLNFVQPERGDLAPNPEPCLTIKAPGNRSSVPEQETPIQRYPVLPNPGFLPIAHAPLSIQREVSFTLKDKGNLMARPVVHVNTGDRVDFIESRVKALVCEKDQDRRHIIGYDLIARSLRKIVKNLTVQQTYDWLTKKDSWVDQTYVDTDLATVQQTLPGVEQGLTQWLRNANSNVNNLFCGSSKINRRKGASVPAMACQVKQQWSTQAMDYTQVNSIKALDKRSGRETFFHYGDLFCRQALDLASQKKLQPDNLSVTTIPTAVIQIVLQDANKQLKIIEGGAFIFKSLTLLGGSKHFKSTVQQVSREHVLPERRIQSLDLEAARQGFLANEVDLDESKGYTQGYDTAIANSIKTKDPDGKTQPIATLGMTDKYKPQTTPKSDYHQTKDTIQRSLFTSKSAPPATLPRLTVQSDRLHPAPHVPSFTFLQPPSRTQSIGGQISVAPPSIQRKVSLTLEDKRTDVMSQPIVRINPGARPPLIDKRLPVCTGQDRRHKVGYDLIASSLKGLLKNKTPDQIADWLDEIINWLDPRYLEEDRQPLDQRKVIRTLGAVESMMGQWLINAQNNAANFFCGNEDINRRKGAAIAGFKSGVKQNWVGPAWPLDNIAGILGQDKINDQEVPLQYGKETKDFVAINTLLKDIPDIPNTLADKVLTSLPGTVLLIVFKDNRKLHWGAACILKDVNSKPMIARVSRSFDPASAKADSVEAARQGFVANEIDTPEPDLTQPNATYKQHYEPNLEQLAVLEPVFVRLVQAVLNVTNQYLFQYYQGEAKKQRENMGTQRSSDKYNSYYSKGPKEPKSGNIKSFIKTPQQVNLTIPMLALILETENTDEGYATIIQSGTEGGNYYQIIKTVQTAIEVLKSYTIKPGEYKWQPIYRGVAYWALSRSDHKYRPRQSIPKDYHQTQDQQSLQVTIAKERLERWRKANGPIPPTETLMTRTLKEDDLAALFANETFIKTPNNLKWLKNALHDKTRGINLKILSDKIQDAHSLSNKETIINAFKQALANKWIEFPTGW